MYRKICFISQIRWKEERGLFEKLDVSVSHDQTAETYFFRNVYISFFIDIFVEKIH